MKKILIIITLACLSILTYGQSERVFNSNMKISKVAPRFTLSGLGATILMDGATSGTTTLRPYAAAGGTIVIPQSASTDTLSTRAYARSIVPDTTSLSNRIDLKADTVDQEFTGAIEMEVLNVTTSISGVIDPLEVGTHTDALQIDDIIGNDGKFYVVIAGDTIPIGFSVDDISEGLALADSAQIVNTKSIGEGTYLTGHDADSLYTVLAAMKPEFGRLEFIVDTTFGAPITGDSILVHADFIDKHIEVYRGADGDSLYKLYRKDVGQTYHGGYSFQKATGTVVFTPSFTTGEHVIIESSDSIYWTNVIFEDVLNDGNAEAWYIAAEEYLTKDANDSVSVWLDKTDNDRDLTATNKQQPIWTTNYLTFNGSTNRLGLTGIAWADIEQPIFIYAVIKQLSAPVGWEDENFLFGETSFYIKQNGTTPNLAFYAGSTGDNLTQATIDNIHIIRALGYGEDGHFQIDKETPATADHNFGTESLDDMYIGNNGTNDASASNIAVYELIIRSNADTEAQQNSIYNYLKLKYGL